MSDTFERGDGAIGNVQEGDERSILRTSFGEKVDEVPIDDELDVAAPSALSCQKGTEPREAFDVCAHSKAAPAFFALTG